ncbi:DUF3299 domain-containing protein [Flammeovirga kamogawensis]|uniref:DUF3299 domain-containing protein n=1 Tax=Flammeovirga kamogawensis TaxID=373891 RepID=A0ABX8GXM7_9BACT|nr:DUF3299 domain-containing protein [Flammeovirga kamogawensis]MBB6460707.1 hypothetical protein [Flammeovirga kamogawensis]QWG08061.1 DUF3299 domain-containing protein [Flammeovirga kamogawensis]TRX69867.1 DUF3299 domain-containing protein [Flammeovirga kamogawensis]
MKKNLFSLVIISIFLSSFSLVQNQKDVWLILQKIDWEDKFDKELEMKVPFPIFSEDVRALEGKEISIKGFVLPIDTDDENSMLISYYPFANCFFCGGAGPETIMEVFMDVPREVNDETVTFKGILKLNGDATGMIYQLKDAVEVETID